MLNRTLSLFLLPLTLAACDGRNVVGPTYGSVNNISVSRQDGSGVVFAPNVYAWCGPWEEGNVAEPTVHVLVGDASARWEFRVVQRDVEPGATLSFPNTFIWDQPRGADMFVHAPPNELSSQVTESSGAVMVEGLDCSAGGGIHFTVEATLASELAGLPSVTVTGHFISPWTGPPGS
jgi:hypothetical protein